MNKLQIKVNSLKQRLALLGAPPGNQNAAGPHNMSGIKKALKDLFENVSHDKDGNVVVRDGFFYTGGKTSEHLRDRVQQALDSAGVVGATITGHGEKWMPFKGGASTKDQSHWFVKVKPGGT